MKAFYMARNQYGETLHNIGPHPRKALLEHHGRKHAARIYRDTPTGIAHVGYIVAGNWWTLYKVEPYEAAA